MKQYKKYKEVTFQNYDNILKLIETLGDEPDFEDSSDLIIEFERLSDMIESFDKIHYPIEEGDPILVKWMKNEYRKDGGKI